MLYTIQQLRHIEQTVSACSPSGFLMQAAGKAAAQAAIKFLHKTNQLILVLVGPGNNGVDALETSIHLAQAHHNIVLLYHPSEDARSADAERVLKTAQGLKQITWLAKDTLLKDSYALVIDGLFGIGLKPKIIPAILQTQIEQINSMRCPILALDVPSGLNTDTGSLALPKAVHASHTITFIADKPGLHTAYGRDYAGLVKVANLGIAPHFFPTSNISLNSLELFSEIFSPRPQNSHKGTYGTVAIIGGALGMQGAVILAARAALYSGAGRVISGFIDSPPYFDVLHPEIMCGTAEQIQFDANTVAVIGPGLGKNSNNVEIISRTLQSKNALVIDADALNLMAQHSSLRAHCSARYKLGENLNTILTPHPLEASRLLGCAVETVQTDRIYAAKKLAQDYAAVVILKGAGTVIAHPDGSSVINPTGNAGLASGGTGDVLAGICGALLAQHKKVWQAALAATYLHGAAADSLVAEGIGPIGLCASDIIVEIRRQLNQNYTSQH